MDGHRPLPWCVGPKLPPFPLHGSANQEIEILEHLGQGLHSEVFRVKIQGRCFALKVVSDESIGRQPHAPDMLTPPLQFRFSRAWELISQDVLERGRVDVQDVIHHNDPFHCECRAYGRLKEVNREDLAARAYGYVMLDATTEDKLAQRGFQDWHRHDAVKKQALRCIVKELLPATGANTPAFTRSMLPRMRRDLQDLHAYGIVVWDLRSDNYAGGRIVDFSQAKTVPHIELSWDGVAFSREKVIETCARDYQNLDAVVYEWNEEHPEQEFWQLFLPNEYYGRRLRSHTRYGAGLMYQEGVRLDAIFYDWKGKQPWVVKVDAAATERLKQRKKNSKASRDRNDVVIIKRRGRHIQKKPARRRARVE